MTIKWENLAFDDSLGQLMALMTTVRENPTFHDSLGYFMAPAHVPPSTCHAPLSIVGTPTVACSQAVVGLLLPPMWTSIVKSASNPLIHITSTSTGFGMVPNKECMLPSIHLPYLSFAPSLSDAPMNMAPQVACAPAPMVASSYFNLFKKSI